MLHNKKTKNLEEIAEFKQLKVFFEESAKDGFVVLNDVFERRLIKLESKIGVIIPEDYLQQIKQIANVNGIDDYLRRAKKVDSVERQAYFIQLAKECAEELGEARIEMERKIKDFERLINTKY